MEMTTISPEQRIQAKALTNMPRCDELVLEGLMFPHRSPEKGLCWSQLEAGPDLAQGAYLAPVGDAGRAVYLACGAHVVSSMDAEVSRCEIRERADQFDGLDLDGGLLAVGIKNCGLAGYVDGMIMSIPPIIVALGHLSRGFNTFIQSAGYTHKPGFTTGIVFTATSN